METLGLSPSAPKPENRLEALFWPEIRNEVDVDHIGRQGFWICLVIGLFSTVITALRGIIWAGLFSLVFFLLGGVGVRQRSRIAAIGVFSAYLLSTVLGMRVTHSGPGILGVLFLALLLANVRGTWLSSQWRSRSETTEPPPVPLTETFTDRLTDQLPIYVWPVARWLFYLLMVLQIGSLCVALISVH
jgi:hypothetical protein